MEAYQASFLKRLFAFYCFISLKRCCREQRANDYSLSFSIDSEYSVLSERSVFDGDLGGCIGSRQDCINLGLELIDLIGQCFLCLLDVDTID